ncbi:MAG: cyclic nucleotide-binding/CBS domain-containing protein [Thermodesulfobacteriota bacterium]
MLSIKKIMSKDLHIMSPDTSVMDAAKMMEGHNIGSIIVSNDNEDFKGIITETDIVRKVVAQGKTPEQVNIIDIMTSPLNTIDAESSIVEASDLMDKKHTRHLMVTEKGRLVGVISARDLLHPVYLDREGW